MLVCTGGIDESFSFEEESERTVTINEMAEIIVYFQ